MASLIQVVLVFLAAHLAAFPARAATPPPPPDRIHDPAGLIPPEARRALAEKLATAAEEGADLWLAAEPGRDVDQALSNASALRAAWGEKPINAVLVYLPELRPQPWVHAGGTEAHLFDNSGLQDQLNGAIQRGLALRPNEPIEAGIDALSAEFTILGRRLDRLRQENLLALAAAGEEAPAPSLPAWADTWAIPAAAALIALASLAAIGVAIRRQSSAPSPRYFATMEIPRRLDAPFSGGQNLYREIRNPTTES